MRNKQKKGVCNMRTVNYDTKDLVLHSLHTWDSYSYLTQDYEIYFRFAR